MTLKPEPAAAYMISKIKNAVEAVKSWRDKRDRTITLDLLNKSREGNETGITGDAQFLVIAGQKSLKDALERIDNCFTCYETVLKSEEFYPGEIDEAARNLIICIATELEKLDGIDKESAEGIIKTYWMDYVSKEP